VADKYLQNKLTAPSAKDLYFKAVLLHLANDDTIGASQALERYTSNDPTFFNTRQQKFLAKIIQAINEGKPKDFAEEW
jgi:alpha-soluble NSF attachment protein